MQDTVFQTFDVPGAATTNTPPIKVAQGMKTAVRVLAKNVAATTLFLAGADQDVVTAEGPSSKTYQLDGGEEAVFVLAPRQKLYCVSNVPGGRLSVSVSEAFPYL